MSLFRGRKKFSKVRKRRKWERVDMYEELQRKIDYSERLNKEREKRYKKCLVSREIMRMLLIR